MDALVFKHAIFVFRSLFSGGMNGPHPLLSLASGRGKGAPDGGHLVSNMWNPTTYKLVRNATYRVTAVYLEDDLKKVASMLSPSSLEAYILWALDGVPQANPAAVLALWPSMHVYGDMFFRQVALDRRTLSLHNSSSEEEESELASFDLVFSGTSSESTSSPSPPSLDAPTEQQWLGASHRREVLHTCVSKWFSSFPSREAIRRGCTSVFIGVNIIACDVDGHDAHHPAGGTYTTVFRKDAKLGFGVSSFTSQYLWLGSTAVSYVFGCEGPPTTSTMLEHEHGPSVNGWSSTEVTATVNRGALRALYVPYQGHHVRVLGYHAFPGAHTVQLDLPLPLFDKCALLATHADIAKYTDRSKRDELVKVLNDITGAVEDEHGKIGPGAHPYRLECGFVVDVDDDTYDALVAVCGEMSARFDTIPFKDQPILGVVSNQAWKQARLLPLKALCDLLLWRLEQVHRTPAQAIHSLVNTLKYAIFSDNSLEYHKFTGLPNDIRSAVRANGVLTCPSIVDDLLEVANLGDTPLEGVFDAELGMTDTSARYSLEAVEGFMRTAFDTAVRIHQGMYALRWLDRRR